MLHELASAAAIGQFESTESKEGNVNLPSPLIE